MSDQTIIIGLFAVVQAAFWLWIKTSMAKADKTEQELVNFKLMVADKYVKQTQLDAHMDRIDKSLDEIKGMIKSLQGR